jgi:murein L,D-transpeptidase YcbB/YkuD
MRFLRVIVVVALQTVPPASPAAIPAFGHYDRVRDALSTYRILAQQPEPPAIPTNTPSIRVGDPLPWAAALRMRLERVGDLPASAVDGIAADVYTPALEVGVRSFQRRHGLTDDGVLGRNTIAALNVPVTTRVRQLELALERLRALPRDLEGPVILVNIPMYQLSVWDNARADRPVMTMKVVVGTPGRNATPEFTSTMERVIFRPYWNVPRSIVLGEILPKVRADATYLATHHYELVRGFTDRGDVVAVTPENLEALQQGALRLRQRPGPTNALGLVKFEFPNPYDVYLHDTPTPSAFLREVRALSHGCVRVENPVGLAAWVLHTTTEAVQESTRGPNVQIVPVPRPVHVLVTYTTATVDADGTVHFAQDIYGHDARLDKVLR